MARIHPWRIPLLLLLVAGLGGSLAWTAIAAAPGPIKGAPVATPGAGDDATAADDRHGQWRQFETAARDTTLAYRGSALSGEPADTVSSHRAATAGRSAAGSAPLEDAETAAPAPRPEAPRSSARPPRRAKLADAPYPIQESGRPRHSTDSLLAYDGDPTTSWVTGDVSPMAYAWFDLGAERPIAALRWYQTKAKGPVAVQISNDREEWTTVAVDEQPVADSWRRVDIGQPARFIRIVIGTEQGAADLAEVEIFGPPGAEPTDTEVATARQPVENRPPSVRITGGGEQGRQAAESTVVQTPEADSEAVEITVNGAVTRCSAGERCRVEARPPDVVEDCGDGTTTCTIRISVSGGLAVCDESGGNRGRNSGSGGQCSAESPGGTVDIGDVNR